MKKIILVVVLLALVAGGIFTWVYLNDDDELKVSNKEINKTQTTASIVEQDTPDGEWTIQKQDDVFAGYEIEELFGGDTVKKTANGTTGDVEASFSIAGTTLTKAKIEVDMTTLQSDSSQRDGTQRDRGLETNDFPTATFEQSSDVSISAVKGTDTSVEISGTLTLHGVEKEVTINTTANWDGKVITVTGEIEIELSDYDIEPPDSGFVTVDGNGKIKFQLLFVPAA